jgi:ribosomal protein S27AE
MTMGDSPSPDVSAFAAPTADKTTDKPVSESDAALGDTVCPRCGESQDLAKVKGCIKCLKCGFKFDCNGW